MDDDVCGGGSDDVGHVHEPRLYYTFRNIVEPFISIPCSHAH